MSNRSAKQHSFERYILQLQARFGVTQTPWFWIQQYNMLMYRAENKQTEPLLTEMTSNVVAGVLFMAYAQKQALPVNEIELCKLLRIKVARFHDLQNAIYKLQNTRAVKPSPYEQARQYVKTLPLAGITPTIRQHAIQLFQQHGSWMCRKNFRPIFIALAIYRYLETLYPRVNFRLYRVAAENGASISRMYSICHLFRIRIQNQLPLDSISNSCVLPESNKLK